MSLGLETIATGIEDEVQEAELIAAGWDYGQGWLYGRAAPPRTSPSTCNLSSRVRVARGATDFPTDGLAGRRPGCQRHRQHTL